MIPNAYITEWSNQAPWPLNEQVEQDLVIERALIEIYNDTFLKERLAFRGGTALHKLYLNPQSRYSEDIDLVQINPEPIKPTIMQIQKRLGFIGKSTIVQKLNNNTIVFKFVATTPPQNPLRLKVEINCREHLCIFGHIKVPRTVQSSWFNGNAELMTYSLEELLGSKMRALYQRRKGRDLYDLWYAIAHKHIDIEKLLEAYHKFMEYLPQPPTKKMYLANIAAKMNDDEFLRDMNILVKPGFEFNIIQAYEKVKESVLEKL
jgi:predicted nucleotidyltransferase component of viral defense system